MVGSEENSQDSPFCKSFVDCKALSMVDGSTQRRSVPNGSVVDLILSGG